MMKNVFSFKHLVVLLVILISGCKGTSSSKTSTPTVDNTGSLSPLSPVEYVDSFYYSYNANSVIDSHWNTISTANLDNGKVPTTITIPSGLAGTSTTESISIIKDASRQIDPTSTEFNLPKNKYSRIPYFAIKTQSGAQKYVFNYKRYNVTSDGLKDTIQAQCNSTLEVDGSLAYLPLINSKFCNNLFITDSSLTKNIPNMIHSISISAVSSTGLPSAIKSFEFKLNTEDPVVDLKVYALANGESTPLKTGKKFDLRTRWSNYYTTDGSPNSAYEAALLTDDQSMPAEQVPVDIKFVFKEIPTLNLEQVLFVEEPISISEFTSKQSIVKQRGVFYTKKITLNSIDHFKSKFIINDTVVSLPASGHELVRRNIPANTHWNLVMAYDFNSAKTYSPSNPLLNPLRPVCNIIKNSSFSPIYDYQKKISTKNLEGFYATCHPDTNGVKEVVANELQYLSNKRDTWNEFFSFRDDSTIQNNGTLIEDYGHFYGIKSVRFFAQGCVKYYIRPATNLDTDLIPWNTSPSNIENSDSLNLCGEKGWSYYKFDITDDIENHINEIISGPNSSIDSSKINSLILKIKDYVTPERTRSDFIFNGTTSLNSIF